jgi:hypothetical protein
MFLFCNLLTILCFSLIFLDTIFYTGFTQNHIYINSGLFLLLYLAFILILNTLNIKTYSKNLKTINNKFIFPFLIIAYAIILYLEKTNYPNFVFTRLHINRLDLFNLVALSGLIFYISFPNFKYIKSRVIYYLLPLSLVLIYFMRIFSSNFFELITAEDAYLENGQFIFYLIASIYSFKVFKILKQKNTSKVYYRVFLLLSFFLAFVAFEEISWGQRFFNIKTPDSYKNINVQNELTLHNIKHVQYNFIDPVYVLIGIYGSFSQIILRRFKSTKWQRFFIFTPPFYLTFAFFTVSAYYIILNYFKFTYLLTPAFYNNFIISQEVSETYLALAFLIYTKLIFDKIKNIDNKSINNFLLQGY